MPLVSNKAEESGCKGVIAFVEGYEGPTSNADTPLLIPYVYIEKEDGMKIIQNKIGSNATIQVEVFGAACFPPDWGGYNICHQNLPCENGNHCQYAYQLIGRDMYNEGYCDSCPTDANGDPNPLGCYFDEDLFFFDTVQNVESCASSCDAEAALESRSCKFCPSDLTKFRFGIENEEEK
jgi:hypothetical protein